MPDIGQAIAFTEEQQRTIAGKVADPAFGSSTWSLEDLQDLRSAVRAHYRTAQHGLCAYCKQPVSTVSAANCHVEHIAPKSLYPQFMFEPKNLCVVCADCNEIKRDQEVSNEVPDTVNGGASRRQYPRSSGAFKIVHPHFDSYFDHIEIFHRFYVDRTPKGHFTIGACRLNRYLHENGWTAPFYDDEQVAQAMRDWLDGTTAAQKNAARDRLLRMLVL